MSETMVQAFRPTLGAQYAADYLPNGEAERETRCEGKNNYFTEKKKPRKRQPRKNNQSTVAEKAESLSNLQDFQTRVPCVDSILSLPVEIEGNFLGD